MITKEFPYHVTARCNNKEAFSSPLPEVWRIISDEIATITERFGCKIHAFVLMPNHFHLLLTTPNENLGVIMQTFMILITKRLNSNSRRSGRIFGSRYHWSLIDNEEYFDCALKYIYRNPVKASLSKSVEDYEFSTFNQVLEERNTPFVITPPIGHMSNIPKQNAVEFIRWLNRPFSNEIQRAIQIGFRKTRFNPGKLSWKKDENLNALFKYE